MGQRCGQHDGPGGGRTRSPGAPHPGPWAPTTTGCMPCTSASSTPLLCPCQMGLQGEGAGVPGRSIGAQGMDDGGVAWMVILRPVAEEGEEGVCERRGWL